MAYNGVLYMNSKTRMADITDGTSNVLLMGEQTDWAIDVATGNQTTCRASILGSSYYSGDWWTDQTIQHGFDHADNTATITVNVGTRICPGGSSAYAGDFASSIPNTPFRSAHTGGGANFAFADGSVVYITPRIDLTLFKMLAIRDSGDVKTLGDIR